MVRALETQDQEVSERGGVTGTERLQEGKALVSSCSALSAEFELLS